MLTFILKKEWYEKIKSGKKTIEYREVKPYWTARLWYSGCLPTNCFAWDYEEIQKSIDNFIFPIECRLRLGYKSDEVLSAFVKRVEIINGKDTDLHIDKPVYAIHLKDIKECV